MIPLLSGIITVDLINCTAIELAITQLREMGETDWQATNSVPTDRFHIVSEKMPWQ